MALRQLSGFATIGSSSLKFNMDLLDYVLSPSGSEGQNMANHGVK